MSRRSIRRCLQEFEVGASWMWHDDEFAGGAFALFDPGQQTLLHEQIIAPEGRIHFAGEHASLLSCLDPGRDRIRTAGGHRDPPRAVMVPGGIRGRIACTARNRRVLLRLQLNKKTPQVPCTARF